MTRPRRGLLPRAGVLGLGLICLALPGPHQPPPEQTPSALRLDLNLPAYRLDVYSGTERIRQFTVAIGSPEYPTPVGRFLLSRVELNPSWTPPSSPWALGRKPMPPGPANPMGRAKVKVLPLYYLHGTPDSASIGKAVSHGCIRLRNADMLTLADLLLAGGAPELADSERVSILRDTVQSVAIDLADSIELTIRYDLLEVVDDTLAAYPDIYRRRATVPR